MQRFRTITISVMLVFVLAVVFVPALAQEGTEVLTVYSGRSESLIAPILEQFSAATGVQVEVLYGDTASIASQLLEEGANTPADVVITQDGGALGALAAAGSLDVLPNDVMERSLPSFSSPENLWVGISGRARVLVYNPEQVEALGLELPASILDLTAPEYSGVVGWAPTNASFQTNITAMRVMLGDEATAAWLEGMVANGTVAYEGNTPLNTAVINGEIAMGVTNHYYMFQLLADNPDAQIAQHFFPAGDAGSLINVAGAGVLAASDQPGLAQRLILYLLSTEGQQYFVDSTYEYPVVEGIAVHERLTPLSEIQAPDVDLSNLSDLQGSIDMIEASGALDN
jgi:iron(III) transport system substrate-binding protein